MCTILCTSVSNHFQNTMRHSFSPLLLITLLFSISISSYGQKLSSFVKLSGEKSTIIRSMATDQEGNLIVTGTCANVLDYTGTPVHTRIMTYNIQNGALNTQAGTYDFGRIASVIQSARPDIVAIQEVDNGSLRTGKKNWMQELGVMTGMYAFFGATITTLPSGFLQWKGEYGIGILSKERPLSWRFETFNKSEGSTDEVRGMLICEFPEFFFVSTHFSLNAPDRLIAAKRLNELAQTVGKPIFLAGDFNALPTYEAPKELSKEYVILSTSESTFPSSAPAKCIDWIMCSKRFSLPAVLSTGIVRQPGIDMSICSDHLPVWVDVRL